MNFYVARQPILDCDNNVYAYELLYRSNGELNMYNGISGDESTADVVQNAFMGLDVRQVIGGGTRAFINFTGNLLKRGLPKLISPDILVVEVLENQLADNNLLDAVLELRERGYTIALDDFEYSTAYTELFNLCDLVKIDFRTPLKSIKETAYVCRYSNKIMLAEKVETREECEFAKKLGCTYMQGYYFAKPSIMSGSAVQPLPVNLMQVMQLMAEPEPEISDIVEILSRDAAMCQRILRLINSVYFGMSNKVSTISQAILILGLDYLREWVYLMGMQKITNNESAEAIRLSLLMAKFCKKIALNIPDAADNAESFYLMGLLSMVVFGGERALAQVLDEFPLTDDIKRGLLRRGGIYSDIFEMAMLYINADWEHFDEILAQYSLRSELVADMFVECTQEIEKVNIM
ncbi:MAG: HDOD domain-containing protein [Oscillospiraceae bacterium]|nr:HDOD domain-containing protein [Oscillospiraceae bacterium]